MGKETDVTLDRNRGLGGSDIASVMGDSPFLSRWDLLRQKVGIIERDFKGNEFTTFGHTIEPKIRDYINETYGYNFEPDYVEEDADKDISTYYHSDGNDSEKATLLEVKSTSVIAKSGEEETVYRHYYEQLLYGMMLHGYRNGVLAVYERPEDMDETFDPWRLQVYKVDMDDFRPLTTEIVSELVEFKADWRWLKEHPDISEAELPSRTKYLSIMESACTIDHMAVPIGWLVSNEKVITDTIKRVKTELCKQMIEHKVKNLSFDDLGIKVACVPRGEDKVVSEFDEIAFAYDHPDLYKEYLKDKVKKGKSEYVRVTSMAEREKA